MPYRAGPWPTVLTFLVASFLTISSMYVFVPLLDQFATTFSIGPDLASRFVWMNTGGYAAGTLLVGWFLKTCGLRLIYIVGLLGVALSNLALCFLTSYEAWMVLRILSGLSSSIVVAAAWAWVFSECPAEHRPVAVSCLSLDLMLSYSLGLPIGVLVVERFGLMAFFGTSALVLGLCVFPSMRISNPSSNGPYSFLDHLRSIGNALADPTCRMYIGCLFLWSGVYHLVFNFLGTWFSIRGIQTPESRSLAFLALGVAASTGCFLGPRLHSFSRFAFVASFAVLGLALTNLREGIAWVVVTMSLWIFGDRAAFTRLFSRMYEVPFQDVGVFSNFAIFALLLSSTIVTAGFGWLFPRLADPYCAFLPVYTLGICVSLALVRAFNRRVRAM